LETERRRRRLAGGKACDRRCRVGLQEEAYSYLLGMYLGDGYIVRLKDKDVWRLMVTCDARYPDIIERVMWAIGEVSKRKVGARVKEGCLDVGAYWKHWPCFFPQHGPGRKHDRLIALEDWQTGIVERFTERFVKGLIESDGSRFINPVRRPSGETWRCHSYPRYMFTNRSDDIRKIFCDALDLLGVEWRTAGDRNISIARRRSVEMLDTFVGPKS
jgi:hypothetical protein